MHIVARLGAGLLPGVFLASNLGGGILAEAGPFVVRQAVTGLGTSAPVPRTTGFLLRLVQLATLTVLARLTVRTVSAGRFGVLGVFEKRPPL